MYPSYTWTNSYPMHFAPNEDTRAKEIPFHMKMDPNTAPNSPYHQPWPYYPVPHDYHGCCNHSYLGGGPYSFRPPYPHYPPPPPTSHTYGFYPPFPGAYPAYSTPPPHYSVEQPRYDYDKNNQVPHHFCGYNHQEDENKSRIVREEPKVETKTSESLVPLFLKESPYPIMWIPSGNVNNESKAKENENMLRIVREEPRVERKRSESSIPLFLKDSPYPIMWIPSPGNVNNESKAKENENKSRMEREEPKVETKRSESSVPLFLKDSPYPIMWVHSPSNVNNESKAKENEKKSSMQREEPEVEKKTSESLVPLFLKDSPYPIMWVPSSRYKNEESKVMDKEKRSQDSASLKDTEPIKRDEHGEGKLLPFPIFWLPSKNNEVATETKDDNVDLVARKRLPDENKRQVSDSEAESEIRNKHVVQKVIPVKQVGANEEKKSVETKVKLDSVEKKDNGIEEGKASPKSSKLPPVCLRIDPLPRKKKTSRSPSPPGVKDRVKSSQPETHSPEILKKDEEQSEGKIKTDMVTTDANKVENNGLAAPCEDIPKDEKGKAEEKKNLSEQDAALMIQSAYRGFEVRKSQPLTKLRKIGEVSKQAVEIRNRIWDMESSSSTVRIDDKQKLIIGETIMSLLLKLDTIQGLHPIVRDIRKSVAKELVGLQEKLDSLTSIKSETPIVETVPSSTDDAIEEKSDQSNGNDTFVESGSSLSGNHGVDAKESHHEDDAEAYNTNLEPQLELRKEESVQEPNNEQPVDDGSQQKFDQVLSQYDSTNEAKDFVGNDGDTKPEQLVDNSTGELNNNKIQMLETEKPVDNSDQEKSDHMQAESDSTCGDVGLDTTIVENHEVEAIESVDNNGEGARDTKTEELIEQNTEEHNIIKHVETEQPLDDSIHEKSDVKFGTTDETMKSGTCICEHHEVESVESCNDAAEVGDISQESIVELSNNLETEQPVEKENLDQRQAQYESDIENVDASEHSNMEDIESRDVSVMEMNDELSKEDAMEGIQEDLIVPTDEAPKADDVEILMEDVGEAPPTSPTENQVINTGDGKLIKDLGGVPSVSPMSGGDRTLMEENEKLRVAVEELLKAGNEQLGVIKELTGKVKDLEKKLSKKNKKIKVNKCRSRDFVVHDELSDCLV